MTALALVLAATVSLTPVERMGKIRAAHEALDVWDLPAAKAAAEALETGAPDDPDAIEARAYVRFHEGRYAEAVKLLDLLATKFKREERSIARLVRKTAKVTEGFREKRGKHFTVKFLPGQDALLADWTLETLEAQRAALEADLGYVPPETVPVEIYPTGDKFAVVTTLTRQEIETTGTIALCKFNRLMITTPGALSFGYAWRDTLAHEYTHYVVARMTGNKVPIWLHEGLAKYLEVRWRRPTGGEPSPTTETVLAEALQRSYFVPLQKMHPSIAKLPTAFDATLAFAEVESLIAFAVGRWKNEGLRSLLEGLRDEEPMDVALLGAFGVGLEGLEATWKEHLAAHPPTSHPDLSILPVALKDPKADAEKSGAAHKGLSKAAADHLRLGDLLAGEVRPDAAVVEYRKAREAERAANGAGGHGPIFDYKIAATHLANNRFDEARKALDPVLSTYPTYAPALKASAKAALALRDPKAARAHIEASLMQAPFDPEVYLMWADACGKLQDAACVERATRMKTQLLELWRDR